jgi:hypothetical protein
MSFEEIIRNITDFIKLYPQPVTALTIGVTSVISSIITHQIDKRKMNDSLKKEKFNSVILPCMLIIEPLLYKDITAEKLRELRRICRQKPNLISIQVFHWIDYKLDYIEKGIGDDKLAKEAFFNLCGYFSHRYDKLSKLYNLQKRGLQYKQHFNQYDSKGAKHFDLIIFWVYFVFAILGVIVLYAIYFELTF